MNVSRPVSPFCNVIKMSVDIYDMLKDFSLVLTLILMYLTSFMVLMTSVVLLPFVFIYLFVYVCSYLFFLL